jgi:DNA-directed RNA polymerase specialized sigma24 family protein
LNAVEQVERLLPELYGRWRSQLRRHPQLAASHDDILQLTAQDLLAAVRTRSEPLELDRLRRLGFAILKRRVADAYRSQVRRWARDEPLEDQQVARDVNTDPARVAYFAILLRSVVALMADMDIKDRELLLRSLDDDATTEPMTDAERKRLSRARERLRLLIDKKHN